MNTIGQARTPDPLPRESGAPAPQQEAQPQGTQDQVSITSSGPSLPRKALEGVGGVIGGVVESAINVPAGFVGGLVEGVDEKGGTTPFNIASVLELGTAGALAGTAFFGIPGAIGGGVAGLVLGGIRLGVHHEAGLGDRFSQKLEKSVKKAISDNVPSGKKARDMAKNATEGAILGSIIEGREGWKAGFDEGRGVVSGVIEGTKGIAGVVTGKIGPEKPVEEKKDDGAASQGGLGKIAKAILSLPRKTAGVVAGLISGTIGAAASTPTGLIQGIGEGATKEFDGVNNGFYKMHRWMAFLEFAAAGAAAGFMMGGPVGLGIGLGSGIVAGSIVKRIERKSGADKEITGNVSQTLEKAASDNPDTGSKVHDVVRNTIEGAMVGTASGAKEGFKKGFEGGIGAVDGFVEGVKGFFGAVTDIAGKKK
jgi:hypothetical protein